LPAIRSSSAAYGLNRHYLKAKEDMGKEQGKENAKRVQDQTDEYA